MERRDKKSERRKKEIDKRRVKNEEVKNNHFVVGNTERLSSFS
jgi:hypothetical protein